MRQGCGVIVPILTLLIVAGLHGGGEHATLPLPHLSKEVGTWGVGADNEGCWVVECWVAMFDC